MIKYILLLFATVLHSVEFVLFTEPKTGTHLLIPILHALTGKKLYWAKADLPPNHSWDFPSFDALDKIWAKTQAKKAFLHLHAYYSPELDAYLGDKTCINFFVQRDPRDKVVSLLNHYKHIQLNDKSLEHISSDDERLLLMIQRDLRSRTLEFMGWLNSPNCCVLDFNKLMGAHGGAATDQDAVEEMRKIAKALQLSLSDEQLSKVYKWSFGKGWSFFRGKVGAWKEYFNEAHKAAVKMAIGDLLIELGYEKDYDW